LDNARFVPEKVFYKENNNTKGNPFA
jgi:hypothetical protein